MFDIDQDGILNLIEAQHTLTCLGFRANAEQVINSILVASNILIQVKSLVAKVGVDQTHFSLSFNEYLTLISVERNEDATENSLLHAFL